MLVSMCVKLVRPRDFIYIDKLKSLLSWEKKNPAMKKKIVLKMYSYSEIEPSTIFKLEKQHFVNWHAHIKYLRLQLITFYTLN